MKGNKRIISLSIKPYTQTYNFYWDEIGRNYFGLSSSSLMLAVSSTRRM